MTKIAPFKAIVYNQQKIKDLSSVVCPPYDVISPQKQQYYHNLDPFNFIHILLRFDLPGEDKYQRSAIIFQDWLNSQVLIREHSPAIYFYSQQYNLRGQKKTRMGFIALLGLEDKNASVFAHEYTRLAPKEDRLRLIQAVKASLSPIFVVFADKNRVIQRAYEHVQQKEPLMDIIDDELTVHKLWRIDSREMIDYIVTKMSREDIFIADGHHRYEVACAYREQMKKNGALITGDEGFNYTLAYFTNTDPRGLTVLAIHRLVELKSGIDMDKFLASLKDYFDVEEIKDKTRFFFLMEKAGGSEHVLGMYKNSRFWLLRLKNVKILDKMITDKPKDYRSLDVSILNYIILKNILGLNLDDKSSVSFNPNAEELISSVDNNASSIAFFLNPVRMQQIMSVALSGERMPSKSTYFYPKVASGLVINKFNE